MTELRRMRRTGVFSLLLVGALGCSGSGTDPDPDPTPVPDPVPTTMTVDPAGPSIADGGTRQLTATVIDQRGVVMTTFPGGATIAWTSRDAAVASVDGNGLVTALRPGTAWIRAGVGNAADSTRVTVTPVPAQLAAVGSATRTGITGRVVADSLAVRVTDRHGSGVAGVAVTFAAASGGAVAPAAAVTGADGTARTAWRLGATAGAQTATATVAALTPVTFTATAEAPAPASITIAPAFAAVNVGATQAFGATVRDAGGEIIPGAPAGYQSSSTAIATVSGGTAAGVSPGVGRIIASTGALADTATVAVLGPASLLATAFPGGSIHATARPGDTVRVPVLLDLSRPSPTNELGSAQLDVLYDPAVLRFVRAEDAPGSAVWHLPGAGRFALAFAATEPSAPGPVRLATLVLVVQASAPAGAVSRFEIEFAEPPRSTSLAPFSAPIVVPGRVRVR